MQCKLGIVYFAHRQPSLTLKSAAGIAHLLSDYLTSETGIQIVFESAIVPRWKDSRICFANVYVSRRPGGVKKLPMEPIQGQREASRLLNAGEHHGDSYYDHSHERPDVHDPPKDVTYFDLTIDSVTVTLSLWRWWNGKGIITDAEVKGVRGVIGEVSVIRSLPGYSLNLVPFGRPAPSDRTIRPGSCFNPAYLSTGRFSARRIEAGRHPCYDLPAKLPTLHGVHLHGGSCSASEAVDFL